jgi:hypothetical protein
MITTTGQLLAELHGRGLAPDIPGKDAPHASERPWYIGLLLGVAGWVAGLFLLVVVFSIFKPDSPGAALFFSIVLLGAAWGLFRVDPDGAFVTQLALALSVAGQVAVLFGIHETFFKHASGIASIGLSALVLQLGLVVLMPNRLHRIMSTLFAVMGWAIFVRYGLWDQPSWVNARGGELRTSLSLPLALAGWAIVWLPVGALLYVAIRREPAWMAAGRQAIVRPATVGLIVGLAVATLLSHPFESFSWGGEAVHRKDWLALWPMLSALGALGALAAAFALGNRGLVATCVVAALLHAAHFYYAMGTSLLVKSATMLVLGALLLGAAHRLKRGRAP